MRLPRISIITSCLNDARHLGEALASIHGQGYPGLEHIVIDGGSTDGSVEIIRLYEGKLAYWRSEPDAGHGDALWKGFQKATGEVVTWICSNDMLLPGSLAAVGAYFAERPNLHWVVGNGLVIDEESKIIERLWAVPFTVRSLMFWRVWSTCQPAVFMRLASVQRVGGFDKSFNVSPDTDLFMRLAQLGKPEKIHQFLGALRVHADSQTILKADELASRDEEVRRRAGMPRLPRSVRKVLMKLFDWRFRAVRIANELKNGDSEYKVGMRLVPSERIEA